MVTLCYIFIYAFEHFIAYIFFGNKFEVKRNLAFLICCNFLSFAIQFGINLANIPELNLVSFFVCYATLAILCYDITVKQTVFNIILLEGLMITTELVIMYGTSTLLQVELEAFRQNNVIILIETIGTKLLYFLTAFSLSKISQYKYKKDVKDFSVGLAVLPCASIFITVSYVYFSLNYNVSDTVNFLFTLSSLILMISNVIVFLLHAKIINTLNQNTELLLEKQRTKINLEYYNELERQHELSAILIHDIKKHLNIVREYALSNESDKITEYIDTVYDDCDIKKLKKYSKNKLINVITNKYAGLCENSGIYFDVDIRNVDLSFIKDSDLTALLDNLLENAFEAANNSKEKEIELKIDKQNEQYICFAIRNSTDIPVHEFNGIIQTSKKDKNTHGYGIRIIKRITKKYNGQTSFSYDEENKVFFSHIIIKSTNR